MPLHTAHASTRWGCKQPPRWRHTKDNPIPEDCISVSRTHHFCSRAKEECILFFKSSFSRIKENTQGCIRMGVPYCFEDKDFLPVTQFHIALVHDTSFAGAVLEALTSEEAGFVLNALVDYKRTHQPGDLHGEHIKDRYISVETTKIGIVGHRALTDWQSKNFDKKVGYSYQLCLGLALCSGSLELVKLLLERGANLQQTDLAGNNIIHQLVDLSLRHPHKAVKMYHAILQLVGEHSIKESLVLATNNAGHTPLDVAAIKCLPEIMHVIINTEGIYKFLVADFGTHCHNLYDVTREEKDKSQHGTSLLHLISVVTEKQMVRLDEYGLFEKEPFATWLKIKSTSNLSHTKVWMAMWVMYVFIYLISVIWYGIKRHGPPIAYNIVVLIISGIFLLLDVRAMHIDYPYLKMVTSRMWHGDFPITFANGYKLFQSVFVITMILSHSMSFWEFPCEKGVQVTLYIHVLNVFFGLMSLLFFTQLSEGLGHYLTVVEKMIQNILAFFSLACVIFAAFAVSFFILYIVPYCPSEHINGTSPSNGSAQMTNESLPQDFATIYNSLYETFMLILAVTAPRNWYFEGSHNPTISIVMYTLCLIINTLVLLNLLIAIMNERVVDVCRHKHCILKINRLSIYLLIEGKRKSDVVLLQRLRLLSGGVSLYKNFYCTPDESKVYLHVVEWSNKC